MTQGFGKNSFLGSLDQALADRLIKALRTSNHRSSEIIVTHEDRENLVYFVLSGRAQVMIFSERGKEVPFRTIPAGGIFGELSAIDNQPRSASVVASENSVVGTMSKAELKEFAKAEPEFVWSLLIHLAQQVRALTTRIVELDTLQARERLFRELVRLAKTGVEQGGEFVLDPAPTNRDIAATISWNREAVSRAISKLGVLGIVKKDKRRMIFQDLKKLKAL